MNRRILCYSLLGLSVASCSSVDDAKRASGDFEYANKQEAKVIAVPSGLQSPKQAKDFAVTAQDKINAAGPVGAQVDVRAPAMVLPIANSSRVEQTDKLAKIWFDQVFDDKDLQLFIYQAIEQQLATDEVSLTTVDADNKVFESGWFKKSSESGLWLWKSTKTIDAMRFRYQLETKPHGRSVALSVVLAEYGQGDKLTASAMDPIDQQRAEVAMLNAIVGQVDYQYRLQQRENQLLRATQKLVSLTKDKQGNATYLVEMERDDLWANMPLFFDKYGFTTKDLNESKKIYYVNFVKPDSSLWDRIWGDDVPAIDLPDGDYQFKLTEDKNSTLVAISDANGNLLGKDDLMRIFDVMEIALSFREN